MMLFVYTVLTVGMTVMVHTCGGVSETLIATAVVEDPCGCDDAMTEDAMEKCCTTEVTTAKLDDAQKVSTASIIEKLTVVGQIQNPIVSPANNDSRSYFFTPTVSPPSHTDLTIVNSVFLI